MSNKYESTIFNHVYFLISINIQWREAASTLDDRK